MHKLLTHASGRAYGCKRVLSVKHSLPDVRCVGERLLDRSTAHWDRGRPARNEREARKDFSE